MTVCVQVSAEDGAGNLYLAWSITVAFYLALVSWDRFHAHLFTWPAAYAKSINALHFETSAKVDDGLSVLPVYADAGVLHYRRIAALMSSFWLWQSI